MFMRRPIYFFPGARKRSRLSNVGRIVLSRHQNREIGCIWCRQLSPKRSYWSQFNQIICILASLTRRGKLLNNHWFNQDSKFLVVVQKILTWNLMSWRLTVCSLPSFFFGPDPEEPLLIITWGDEKEGLGLNRCSKIAMIRNIDIKIAVATNPKEIAFMEVPKFFHGASWSTTAWDGLGSELVYMSHGFDLSEPNSLELMLYSLFWVWKFGSQLAWKRKWLLYRLIRTCLEMNLVLNNLSCNLWMPWNWKVHNIIFKLYRFRKSWKSFNKWLEMGLFCIP